MQAHLNGLPPERASGVLLHPTSLPSPSFETSPVETARRFIDLLAEAGFRWWQVLPLGPVDAQGSPYSLRSAQAGHPGLFAAAAPREDLESFRAANDEWLAPYAAYEALRRMHGGQPWWDWPAHHRECDPDSLHAVRASPVYRQVFAEQSRFESAWQSIRRYGASRGVRVLGDLPFYVDHDSADTWWSRELFRIGPDGRALEVAGVPPDYFNPDGQRWGNPLYDWHRLQARGFDWWITRLRVQLRRFDALRVDHFRALVQHWAVPADASSAREGQWRDTPGEALLAQLQSALGTLPLVAEDLGSITPEVHALRERFGLPGMLVLQFAFDGSPDNPYLPGNHAENSVVYTGTHDNDTTLGWYGSLDDHTRGLVERTLATGDGSTPRALIEAAFESPARLAIVPLQDLLELGSDARMNVPGTVGGNWQWRFDWSQVTPERVAWWREMNRKSGRARAGRSGFQQ